jgi:hypothetical protein
MPRKRRIAKGQRGELDAALYEFFVTGNLFAPRAASAQRGSKWGVLLRLPTAAHQEQAWHDHRAAMLDTWIAERPGTRPWAWWRYEALDPRRILKLEPRTSATVIFRAQGIGLSPEIWATKTLMGNAQPDVRLVIEAQAEYLRRNALLLPTELRALKPDDFSPVVLEPWEGENDGNLNDEDEEEAAR